MDVYKTPGSELIDDHNRSYKPVRGILVGLSYTLVLAMIASMILTFVFGFNLTSPNLESEIANSSFFMITDTITGAIVLFYGGRAVGKRTPGKELKFGAILAIITAVIYLILMISTDSFITYPLIYNLATFVVTAIAIPYGSKSGAKI